MALYRRNLPHWQPEGARIFLTWRLHGTLPRGTVTLDCGPGAKGSAGRRFVEHDHLLDLAATGPQWLSDPRIASCMVNAIERGEKVLYQYELNAYVVMPNHVHMLITPRISVTQIMHGLKGVSAREANRILGRTGKTFWQDESFDRWVRTGEEFGKIRSYIERNPVTAGLAKTAAEWPWSSAGKIPWQPGEHGKE